MKTDKRITRWKFEFLLLMCSFGCLGPVVRGINLPTAVIVWARALISACALLLFHLIFRKKIGKENLSFLIPMLASGVFLAIDWIGLFASYRYTTIATATLCYYITPVLVLIGAAVLLKERLTARKVICIAVAFLGMILVSGVVENGLPGPGELKGVLLALLGAAGYSGVILINKKYPQGDPLMRTFVQLSTAAVIMTFFILKTTRPGAYPLSLKDVILLFILGVVMTAAAYIAYFSLVVRIPSSSVAFFSYADPVVAVMISVFLMGEPFSLSALAGGILIMGAALISELAPGAQAGE